MADKTFLVVEQMKIICGQRTEIHHEVVSATDSLNDALTVAEKESKTGVNILIYKLTEH